jgi:hypothetical protein
MLPITSSTAGISSLDYDDGELRYITNFEYAAYTSEPNTIYRLLILVNVFKSLQSTVDQNSTKKLIHEIVKPYALSSVLSDLGKPSIVQILTSGDKEDTMARQFRILLIYPNNGVLIQYISSRNFSEKTVSTCLEYKDIEMWLYPPGDAVLFDQLLEETRWADFWPPSDISINGWKSIDQATGMTIDEFYETFLENPEACLSTPADLWK